MNTEKNRRVVITGLGTVNPTGNTVAASWANMKAGRSAVGPINAFDATDFKVKLAAEVKDFDPAERIDKREARKMARFTQFAVAAADEAVRDSGLALEEIDRTRFGVILSSGIGGLPTIEEEHTRGQQRGFEKVSPYFVPMSIGNMAAGQVAIRFGLQGMCSCPTTACAGGTNAIGDAFHRIRDGYEDRMLCGGSESCISPLGVGGFASMKALCTADDPTRASIPFDTAQRLCDGRGQRRAAAGRARSRQSARCQNLCRGRGLWCQLRCLPLYRPGTGRRRRCSLHAAGAGRRRRST